MANIQYSALVADMSGKHNGSVHSRNRSGAYIRIKHSPVNRKTTFQQGVKAKFTSLSQAWRALTQAQRDQWNAGSQNFSSIGKFGRKNILSGFNFYKRLNGNLDASGNARITTPPNPGSVFAFTSYTQGANTTGSTMLATFAPAIPAGTTVLVFASPPVSAGVDFIGSKMNYIGNLTSADASPKDIDALYNAKYGANPPIGMKVFVELRPVTNASGLEGTPFSASAIAV